MGDDILEKRCELCREKGDRGTAGLCSKCRNRSLQWAAWQALKEEHETITVLWGRE